MTATLTAVFNGLVTRLDTIPGLNIATRVPDSWNFPALLVVAPDVFDSDGLADVEYTATFNLFLLVSTAAEEDQRQFLPFIDPNGSKSVLQAIKADRKLGGTVDDARFLGWPRQMTFDTTAAYRAYGKEGQVRVWIT